LSWMVLRGRCRFCRGPISIRYPLVELATGAAFAVVGLTFGGHWGVPGFCALAATFIALVGIEGDGMALPARVAVVGTAVAVALLVAAGAADRRWSHVIGLALGTAVAGTVAVAIGPERPRRGSGSASRAGVEWGAGAALLPAGAALGWLGPWAGAEGLGTAVVVALVAGRSRGRGSSETDGRPRRRVALALALGVVVATVVARATGAGPGT
ncbi:MAG: prepilin peptidase, partial [Acidimicrobiales bacterium]